MLKKILFWGSGIVTKGADSSSERYDLGQHAKKSLFELVSAICHWDRKQAFNLSASTVLTRLLNAGRRQSEPSYVIPRAERSGELPAVEKPGSKILTGVCNCKPHLATEGRSNSLFVARTSHFASSFQSITRV